MTDELDVINHWKHRALIAERKLEDIEEYLSKFCDICPYNDDDDLNVCNNCCLLDDISLPIINKIQGAEND